MDEQQHVAPHTPQPASGHAHDLADYYVRKLWWPVCIAVLFQISALYNTNRETLIVVANAALALVAAIHVVRTTRHWGVAMTVGALSGAVATIAVSLYRLIQSFDLVMIFRLFTDPLFTGMMDGIAAGLFCILLQMCVPLQSHIQSTDKQKNYDGTKNTAA